jgi:hypothetical protein
MPQVGAAARPAVSPRRHGKLGGTAPGEGTVSTNRRILSDLGVFRACVVIFESAPTRKNSWHADTKCLVGSTESEEEGFFV